MVIIRDIKYAFTNVSPTFLILRTNAFIFSFQAGSAILMLGRQTKYIGNLISPQRGVKRIPV